MDPPTMGSGRTGSAAVDRVPVGTALLVVLGVIKWSGLAIWILTVTWFTWPFFGDSLSAVLAPWRLFEGALAAVSYPTSWAALLVALAAWMTKAGVESPGNVRRWLFLIPVTVVAVSATIPASWLPPSFAVYAGLTLYLAVSIAVMSAVGVAVGGTANLLVGSLGVGAGVVGVALITWALVSQEEVLRASHAARVFTTPARVIVGLGLTLEAEHAIVSSEGSIVDFRSGCHRTAAYCTTLARRSDLARFVASTGIPQEYWEPRNLPDGSRGMVTQIGELLVIAIEGRTSVGVTLIDTRAAPKQVTVRWGE